MGSISKTIKVHGKKADLSIDKHNPTIKLAFKATTSRSGSTVSVKFSNLHFWLPGDDSYYGYKMTLWVRVWSYNSSGTGSWKTHKFYTKSASDRTWDVHPGSFTITSVNNKSNGTSLTIGVGAYASDGKQCFSGTTYKNFTISTDPYDPTITVTYDANGGQNPPANQETKQSQLPLALWTAAETPDQPNYPLIIQYFNEDGIGNPVRTTNLLRPFIDWISSKDSNHYAKGAQYSGSSCTMSANWGYATFPPAPLVDKNAVITLDPRGGVVEPSTILAPFAPLGYSTTAGGEVEYVTTTTYNISTSLDLYPIYDEYARLSASAIPNAQRPGYIFDGWYTNLDYALEHKVVGTLVTATDMTIYAKWIPIPVHQFDGDWKNTKQYVWQMKPNETWVQDAPIFQFDGTKWVNISES